MTDATRPLRRATRGDTLGLRLALAFLAVALIAVALLAGLAAAFAAAGRLLAGSPATPGSDQRTRRGLRRGLGPETQLGISFCAAGPRQLRPLDTDPAEHATCGPAVGGRGSRPVIR
jgi:hypothetical protein